MSGRTTAEIIADLEPGSVLTNAVLREVRDRLAELDAEVARLMVIATDTQLEAEITRALGYIPSRFFNNSDPWEYAVLKMREELDEWRTLDPQQRVEQERHNRAEVEDELRAIDALLPPCPTCDGKGGIATASTAPDPNGYILGATIPCPDCVDGKVPIERLRALWDAVHDPHFHIDYRSYMTVLDHLRAIR